ncbi:hypothetical protein HP532_24315 [Pseudomonas sp. CrR25]|nr:hypothetical protein [Pseudomonas sp. CrR25]
MVTAANTLFIKGADFAIQHGIYMRTLRLKNLGIEENHEYLILWFPEKLDAYPNLSDVTGGRANVSPNGGVKMDLDYPEVATFGLYRINGKTPELLYWVDFDHWPMNGMHLKPGLANGHYHLATSFGVQRPVMDQHRALLLKVVSYLRFGTF